VDDHVIVDDYATVAGHDAEHVAVAGRAHGHVNDQDHAVT
jgi:hypothetical protein